jgi:hypothetical protein
VQFLVQEAKPRDFVLFRQLLNSMVRLLLPPSPRMHARTTHA